MTDSVKQLIKEFQVIANKGWIEDTSKSKGGIGLTFENKIRKKQDNKYYPDYQDIRI